jgi:hypothetical protein
MSTFNLSSLLSSQLQSIRSASQKTGGTAPASPGATAGADFSSMLALRLAEFKSQSVSTLLDSGASDTQQSALDLISGTPQTGSTGSDIASLFGAGASSAVGSTSAAASAVQATGYNTALADPAAAYSMMSFINESEVNFKAQFAELSDMAGAIKTLQRSGEALGSLDAGNDEATITKQLQAFADDYNAWIARFDASVGKNGVLGNVRAAQVAYQELEISVENRFNGATSGFGGLSDLGLTIDESSNRIVVDAGALGSSLATNKEGVVATLKEFSANFSESARLLTSQGNFITNRLDNLDRAIDYLAGNKASLQSEFGTGAPAEPSGQVAAALATYNRVYAA